MLPLLSNALCAAELVGLERPKRSVSTGLVVDGKVVEINGDRVQVNMADLKQAAELGSVESQTRLAEYYQRGKHGLATNRVEAYKWAWVAASAGSNSARHLRQELELFMTTKEAAEGKAAADTYLQRRKAKS